MGDEVVTTPFGKFYVDPEDLIGSTLKAGTVWDGPGFLQVIAQRWGDIHNPRAVILDVGANQGAFTIWLAHEGHAQIVAVEPVPATLQRLHANLDLNKASCADKVTVLPIVAGDVHHRASLFNYDPTNTGGASFLLDTAGVYPVAPLDDYEYLWHEYLTLVVIDAQGWDLVVLQGLQRSIERHYPVIVVEWEAEPLRVDLLPEFMQRAYVVRKWPERAHDYLLLPGRFLNQP